MTKNKLLKVSSWTLVIGFALIGFGFGQLFGKGILGLTIGTGIGLVLFSLTIFRLIRRMDIYNKTEI